MKLGKGIFAAVFLFVLLALPLHLLFAQAIFYGDSANLAQGMVRTWIQMDGGNLPLDIGVTFTAGAFVSLPDSGISLSLNLPHVIQDSLFKHVYLNWNPSGHPPPGIYDAPHFDVHFCTITSAEREAIVPGYDPIPAAPEFLPPMYATDSIAVPGMGVHWVDLLAPEFNGQPFTATMIYGFYHGQQVFLEPMITLAYLVSQVDTTIIIRQPSAYQATAYYPTTYSISFDAMTNTYSVSLGNFIYRTTTAADEPPQSPVPADYVLLKNYPNPFNPQTTIEYALPQTAHVTLKVFNVLGEEEATLVDGMKAQGVHTVHFDGSNLPSGVYLYQLQAGEKTVTNKMLLVK